MTPDPLTDYTPPTPPADRRSGPVCTCHREPNGTVTICPEHCAIGLDHIERLRAEGKIR